MQTCVEAQNRQAGRPSELCKFLQRNVAIGIILRVSRRQPVQVFG